MPFDENAPGAPYFSCALKAEIGWWLDLVAARTAAGMTQHEVAMRMWTTKGAEKFSLRRNRSCGKSQRTNGK
jgi:hypothetical protein